MFSLLYQARGKLPLRGQELEQPISYCCGNVDDKAPLCLIVPESLKRLLFDIHSPPVATTLPVGKCMETLPVGNPPLGSLVDAAVEGQAVAGLVFDDARLLVKNDRGRDGSAQRIARDGDSNLEMGASDHPAQKFERLALLVVGRLQRDRSEVLLNRGPKQLPPFDRLDLCVGQCAADDEPHAAAIPDEPLDSA
jgi:hypothetical protein